MPFQRLTASEDKKLKGLRSIGQKSITAPDPQVKRAGLLYHPVSQKERKVVQCI